LAWPWECRTRDRNNISNLTDAAKLRRFLEGFSGVRNAANAAGLHLTESEIFLAAVDITSDGRKNLSHLDRFRQDVSRLREAMAAAGIGFSDNETFLLALGLRATVVRICPISSVL